MAKRVALFVLGLTLVLGTFLLYQWISGPDAGGGKKATLATSSSPASLPMSFEMRDENGVLQYVITAAKSPEPIKGPDGHPLPGQFSMVNPLATFYDRTGRVIQVRADACRVVIEQGPKNGGGALGNLGGGGGGSKVTDRLQIREGALNGNVRMTIGPRADAATSTKPAGAKPEDLLAGGMRIYMDDELHLDGIQEILTTTGGIHIRGDRVAFDGQGLQLVFNRKLQRIEYLQIEKGNQVIIRNVGAKTLALGPTSQPTTGRGPVAVVASQPAATQLASTQPAKQPPTTYRLSFGQDVKVTVGGADRATPSVLTSDRLYIIFMGGRELGDLSGDIGNATSTPGAAGTGPVALPPPPAAAGPGGIPAGAAPLANVPEIPEPIAPPKADDLVVQWTGPMELRPADERDVKLDGGKDVALEAEGSAARPVTVSDAKFHVQAGRLWYHGGTAQQIVLEPGDFGKVLMDDPNRGSVQCLSASIDQKNNRAVLNGPGLLLAKSGGNETRVTWKTHMDVDLASTPDPTDPRKTTFAVRHAVLFGASVKSDVLDFSADNLDVLIATVAEKGRQTQAMEHLLATGNVVANSFRRPASAGLPALPLGGIQTQRMEITTAKPAGSNMPVPAQMIADGDVSAWRWTDRSKGLTLTDPAQGLQKDTITAPHLVATLAPKAKSTTAPATAATAPADTGFASMGQNFDVTRFVATGGTIVDITPPPASKSLAIRATADSLDANPDTDHKTAVLTSVPGGPPVQVAMGANLIQGPKVLLNDDAKANVKSFEVPGAGVFNMTLPADGKTRKTATRMVVTWQNAMTYDDAKHLATFTGSPVARMLPDAGALDQSDQARLSCEQTLLVQLKQAVAGTRPATMTATTPDANLFATGNLDLDWIEAVGKVEAYGAQVGPDNKPLTRLRLSATDVSAAAPARLRYSEAQHAFAVNGPGAMVVENFRPEKADQQVSAAGESDFIWTGGLRYDEDAGIITFTSASARQEDLVKYYFFPTRPLKFNNAMGGGATATSSGPRAPDFVKLETQQLVATLTKSKETPGKPVDSPIRFGTSGNQEPSKVETTGGTDFQLGTYQIANGKRTLNTPTYRIAGDTMTFDVPTNIATVNGTPDEPAVVEQLGTTNRGSGQSIIVDLTKDKTSVRFIRPQGNITGFGQ